MERKNSADLYQLSTHPRQTFKTIPTTTKRTMTGFSSNRKSKRKPRRKIKKETSLNNPKGKQSGKLEAPMAFKEATRHQITNRRETRTNRSI